MHEAEDIFKRFYVSNQGITNHMNCKTVYLASKMLLQVQGDLINLFVEVKIKVFDSKCYSDKMEFSITL